MATIGYPVAALTHLNGSKTVLYERFYMKKYLPNKPKKWGFKLFVLCDTTGYAYKFEIYSGFTDVPQDNESNLQSSANVVVRLVREVPR